MWFRRRPSATFDDDLQAEIRQHLDRRVDDLIRAGLPPDEAHRRARIEFGSIEAYKDAARDERRGAALRDVSGQIWRELRQGWRRLRRTPVFALFAIASLALGVGATTAIYSIIASLLWPPVGFPHPNQIVVVTKGGDYDATWRNAVSQPDFDDLRAALGDPAGLVATAGMNATIATADVTAVFSGEAVTGNYFSILGVGMTTGRPIQPSDDRPDAPSVVVLSEPFWRRSLGSDPAIVGRTVRVGGQPCTVIGVAGPGFSGLSTLHFVTVDGWIPWNTARRVSSYLERLSTQRANALLSVAARVDSPAAVGRLAAAVATIGRTLDRTSPLRFVAPSSDRPPHPFPRLWSASTIVDADAREVRTMHVMGSVVVAMVVIVACTNLANLMLGRGAAREHELAVRRALGASNARLIREQLAESAILAVAGGVGAMLVARALVVAGAVDLPIAAALVVHLDPRLDPTAAIFATTAILLSLLVFGLAPAIELTRSGLRARLASDTGSGGSSRWRSRGRLIVLQVAMSTALFLIASISVKVVAQEAEHDSGIDLQHLALGVVNLRLQGADEARGRQTIAAIERAAHTPEFEAAALASAVPFGSPGFEALGRISVSDAPLQHVAGGATEISMAATPGIFRTLRVPILAGRAFDARDRAGATNVVVLSEHAARDLFGTTAAVGRTIFYRGVTTSDSKTVSALEVIGIARDTDTERLFWRHLGTVYRPIEQQYEPTLLFLARTTGNPAAAIPTMASIVRSADPDTALATGTTGTMMLAGMYVAVRVVAGLAGGLATLALVLAMSGLYGVLSHLVARRTREIGVRMALGAEASRIRSLVLRDGLRPVAEGLLLGYGMGVIGRMVVAAMYAGSGISPVDPIAFALAAVPLVAAAALACYLPARRASRLDPNVALREL